MKTAFIVFTLLSVFIFNTYAHADDSRQRFEEVKKWIHGTKTC